MRACRYLELLIAEEDYTIVMKAIEGRFRNLLEKKYIIGSFSAIELEPLCTKYDSPCVFTGYPEPPEPRSEVRMLGERFYQTVGSIASRFSRISDCDDAEPPEGAEESVKLNRFISMHLKLDAEMIDMKRYGEDTRVILNWTKGALNVLYRSLVDKGLSRSDEVRATLSGHAYFNLLNYYRMGAADGLLEYCSTQMPPPTHASVERFSELAEALRKLFGERCKTAPWLNKLGEPRKLVIDPHPGPEQTYAEQRESAALESLLSNAYSDLVTLDLRDNQETKSLLAMHFYNMLVTYYELGGVDAFEALGEDASSFIPDGSRERFLALSSMLRERVDSLARTFRHVQDNP